LQFNGGLNRLHDSPVASASPSPHEAQKPAVGSANTSCSALLTVLGYAPDAAVTAPPETNSTSYLEDRY
jgi:hypothetical protein